MAKVIKEEKVHKELKSKTVYHFIDSEKGISQISREVFKNEDKEIHFPIGYNGGPKYDYASKLIFLGFGGNLPVGVGKTPTRGLGFTKILKPLIDFIEQNFQTETIIILKEGESEIDLSEKIITFSEADLILLHRIFKNNYDKHKEENLALASEQLHFLFPKSVKEGKRKYIQNSVSSALSAWEQSLSEFSESDRNSIKELFDKLALTDDFLTSETLLQTKETIDAQYIEDVIDQYTSQMAQLTETATLEKKWQKFLKKHSWIFSFIFSYPIILFEDEAYVGGKNLSNKDGKVTDFLVKNDLTDNVAFIEIKTHKTNLIKKAKAYRGSDVYAMSEDLSGAISQVLNQRDNFQKHFATHKINSTEQFETFNSKCVVLMGSISELDRNQQKSFELFRSNSKDVDILTFDELLARFENLRELMMSKSEN